MGDGSAALAVGEGRRTYRCKSRRPLAERLVDEALDVWASWLWQYVLPRDAKPSLVAAPAEVFEKGRTGRVQTNSISNPVLATLEREEQMAVDWPMRIHAMLRDMPKPHRMAALSIAVRATQSDVAAALGVSQPRVCIVFREMRLLLLLAINLDMRNRPHARR